MFGWTRDLRLKVLLAAALGVLAGCAAPAPTPTPVAGPLSPLSDGFPNQPITIVTGAAGSGVDTFARALNKAAQPFSPVPLVVENATGAAATLRFAEISMTRQEGPEGYGLWIQSFSAVARSFTSQPGKATWNDVGEPVAGALDQYTFYVRADAPWKNLSDFVKYAKDNPGQARIGIADPGGLHHVTSETFARAAGFQYIPVPHAGGTVDAINSLIGGGVDAVAGVVGVGLAQVKEGKIRPIGVSSSTRSKALPDLPTFKEQGYDVAIDQYRAVWALASVSKEHLQWLRQLYRQAAETEEFQLYLAGSGENSQHQRIEEFAKDARKEYATIENQIRALGLHYEQAAR